MHTEKLNGENNCFSQWGVFACSHAAPTTSPWTRQLRERWELIKNDLGDIEILFFSSRASGIISENEWS